MIRNIDESKGGNIYFARFPVLRTAGLFGRANVSWNVVTSGAAADIRPLSGTLTFGDGISLQEIQITARADEVCSSLVFLFHWFLKETSVQTVFTYCKLRCLLTL